MDATRHVPVMPDEVLRCLAPAPGRVIADLTLGGGGHSLLLLEAGATVLGFDRDAEALDRTRSRLSPHSDRFTPVHRDFGAFAEVLDETGRGKVDGVLMDLGLSSDQLDDPQRGFAFRFDGPLDLRFDTSQGEPAWALLEQADAREISGWLQQWGEVRQARRIAPAMAAEAAAGRLRTTRELRELVVSIVGRSRKPEAELARVFQALRIQVNDELTQLEVVLDALPDRLASGGRFVSIAYHSLEDRRVKRMLRQASGRVDSGSRHLPRLDIPAPTFRDLTPKALRPSEAEVEQNPRSRSARLRAGERLS